MKLLKNMAIIVLFFPLGIQEAQARLTDVVLETSNLSLVFGKHYARFERGEQWVAVAMVGELENGYNNDHSVNQLWRLPNYTMIKVSSVPRRNCNLASARTLNTFYNARDVSNLATKSDSKYLFVNSCVCVDAPGEGGGIGVPVPVL